MVNLKINNKSIRDIKLVIFDRDGTLIDLYAYWSWMVNKRSELICNKLNIEKKHQAELMFAMGIDSEKKRIRPGGPVGLKKREIVMQAAIDYLSRIGQSDAFNACVESFREVDGLSAGSFDNIIKPIDGLFDLFNKLSGGRCKIAIATTDKTTRAAAVIDFLGLTRQIDFIAGDDSVKNPKPAADMVNLILERLGIERDRTVVIGDAMTDIQMGINAKVKASVGVLTGLSGGKELKQLTPYLAKSIKEIRVEHAEKSNIA